MEPVAVRAQKAILLLDHTAKRASTSSEELNAQISPRTDDEHNLPYHEDTCKSTSALKLSANRSYMMLMIGKGLLSGL